MELKPVIGLEIHVQLKTKSKLFCGCDNQTDLKTPPNTNVCPICMGHPGVLPVLNKQALVYGLMAALALNCKIPKKAKFDRKNYFYPDLPKAYQISMFDEPICENGLVRINIPYAKKDERKRAEIRITRIHLEEDAAKNTHEKGKTLVDYNRCGTPLAEIVTEPDFQSPQEAKIFLQELRRIMRYLDISNADMEKGHMRCDANISLRSIKEHPGKLHAKTELKNINSFRAVERGLQYEIQRQTKLWEQGKPPKDNTTRGWDDNKGITVEQRGKEESADYRYFPEPDLPPLLLPELVEQVRPKMVELPQAKRERFCEQYGFSAGDALILTEEKETGHYIEKVMSELREWVRSLDLEGSEDEKWEQARKKLIKLLSGWFSSKLSGLMEKHSITIQQIKITPENFAEFLALIYGNRISSTAGLEILEEMLLTGKDPSQILDDKGLEQVSDEEEISSAVQEAIENNPGPVQDYKKGKENALQFLVGQVMKETRGKANPGLVQKLLKKMLK